MTWSIGACHTAHSLLVFQTLAHIYGARLAKPRYQVEFKISQLSAFSWLTENRFLCFHFVFRFDNLLW